MRFAKLALLLAFLGAVGVACSSNDNGGALESPSATNTVSPTSTATTSAIAVTMDSNLKYKPASITVSVGTPVVWTNTSASVNHSVTAKTGATFDSGILTSGQQFTQTFTAPGTIKYFCTVHGSAMSGTITVTQ